MTVASRAVIELDALGGQAGADVIRALTDDTAAAVRVENLVSSAACDHLARQLVDSTQVIEHADVEGLRVIGPSHFQAVRNPALRGRYVGDAAANASRLRAMASPYASPFDVALAFLTQLWPAGCHIARLPSEGGLTPFTIRIYGSGVGIEPHQDVLAAESPGDPVARGLSSQFGANVYLSTSDSGGELELFETRYSDDDLADLSGGPRSYSRDDLGPAVTIQPRPGELIFFPSRRVHSVAATVGSTPRVTVSFFIGLSEPSAPLMVWA